MKNVSHLYIGLWCLYNLQGTLYESGGWVSRGLMLILILFSIYYYLYANTRYKLPSYLKSLSILVFVFTIYGIVNIIFGNGSKDVANYLYLKAIYMSLLPVYPFYVFTKEKRLVEKELKLWVLIFIPIAIAVFFRMQREALIEALEMGSTREEFTNNAGYFVVSLIPIIVIWREKALLQYLMLAVCLAFVIMGMKRGAILVGGLSLAYLIAREVRTVSLKKKIWVLILAGVLITVAYFFIIQMLDTSNYFNARLEQTQEGDASGRNNIYSFYVYYFLNETNIFTFLFGSGADATLRLGEYAHNDWLEIAINNGVLGLCLYFHYWLTLFHSYRHTRGDNNKTMIGLFIIIFFLKSLFSMSYNDIPFFASLAIAFSFADEYMDTNNRRVKRY